MGPLAIAYMAPYFWPCLMRQNIKQWQEFSEAQTALLARIFTATTQH